MPNKQNNQRNRPQLYRLWINIKSRCYNPNVINYKDYGGRGIKISQEWLTFSNFQKDMLPTYKKGLSIDRINNDKGYSKENCKWSNASEQALNRRKKISEARKNNRFFEFKGILDTLPNWARFFRMNKNTLVGRVYISKWSFERALMKGNSYYA